jgi:hypothetical protein
VTKTIKGMGIIAAMLSAAALFVACGGSAPGAAPGGGALGPTATSLVVTTDPLVVSNTSGTEVDVTVTAVSSGGQAVAGVPISLTSEDGVVISPGTGTTDATGSVKAKARLLSRANRAVTVNATGGTVSGTGNFLVQGATLSATVETPRPAVGAQARVRFSLTDASSNPMPGETIRITSSLNSFPPVTAPMDATGTYLLQYTAVQAGADVLLAEAAGARPLIDPRIEIGGAALPPPSSTPSSFSLQAQPATVDSNPTGNTNRSQLIARVFDATNLPVQNAQVSFRIAAGQQFGALATTEVVLTDASGFARTDFIAGAAGSAQDQIKVCALVLNAAPSNVLAGCNATESGVELTVRETPVSVVIGASGKIIVPDELQYVEQFLVQVARVGGAPVQGAIVTVDPIEHKYFFKGYWSGAPRTQKVTGVCENEDANRNDILEPGEDKNNNGRLDPRRPVNFRFVNGPTTDERGQVLVELFYPKSFGSWVSLELSVRVTVGGSESRASIGFSALRVAQDEVASTGGTAFDESPFGRIGIPDGLTNEQACSEKL